MKQKELAAVMDFIYHGESNIYQDDLDGFLNVAEELKLKGLTGNNTKQELPSISNKDPNFKDVLEKKSPIKVENPTEVLSKNVLADNIYEGAIAIPNQIFSGDIIELDNQIKSMMLVGPTMLQGSSTRICTVCGKEGHPRNIKDHIEANHIDGVSLPCTVCEKTFRSRASLRMHRVNQHKYF